MTDQDSTVVVEKPKKKSGYKPEWKQTIASLTSINAWAAKYIGTYMRPGGNGEAFKVVSYEAPTSKDRYVRFKLENGRFGKREIPYDDALCLNSKVYGPRPTAGSPKRGVPVEVHDWASRYIGTDMKDTRTGEISTAVSYRHKPGTTLAMFQLKNGGWAKRELPRFFDDSRTGPREKKPHKPQQAERTLSPRYPRLDVDAWLELLEENAKFRIAEIACVDREKAVTMAMWMLTKSSHAYNAKKEALREQIASQAVDVLLEALTEPTTKEIVTPAFAAAADVEASVPIRTPDKPSREPAAFAAPLDTGFSTAAVAYTYIAATLAMYKGIRGDIPPEIQAEARKIVETFLQPKAAEVPAEVELNLKLRLAVKDGRWTVVTSAVEG